jgi:serine/threonine-protein kinase TNNI3K
LDDALSQVHQLIDNGERPFIPTDTHPEYASLIRRCWEADPDKRPTCAEILETLAKCL